MQDVGGGAIIQPTTGLDVGVRKARVGNDPNVLGPERLQEWGDRDPWRGHGAQRFNQFSFGS